MHNILKLLIFLSTLYHDVHLRCRAEPLTKTYYLERENISDKRENIIKQFEQTIAHGHISMSNRKGTIWFLKDYGMLLGYCPMRNQSMCKHGVLYNIEHTHS